MRPPVERTEHRADPTVHDQSFWEKTLLRPACDDWLVYCAVRSGLWLAGAKGASLAWARRIDGPTPAASVAPVALTMGTPPEQARWTCCHARDRLDLGHHHHGLRYPGSHYTRVTAGHHRARACGHRPVARAPAPRSEPRGAHRDGSRRDCARRHDRTRVHLTAHGRLTPDHHHCEIRARSARDMTCGAISMCESTPERVDTHKDSSTGRTDGYLIRTAVDSDSSRTRHSASVSCGQHPAIHEVNAAHAQTHANTNTQGHTR
jgi:hypothetical protein